MALLETCYCCDLIVASVLIGVYVLVAYVIAFTIELWWIMETEVGLPAPAYLLCLGYFIVFVQTAFLLHGLSVKRSLFLMGWLFVIVIFSIPEAGLVLFMSLYHWQLDHLYGLTELTCWVIRLGINIAGLLIIQSMYSQWKEEVEVMQRLQALNMTSMIPQRVGQHNVHISNAGSLIGQHNDGFVKSTNHLNGSLRRSHSLLPNNTIIPLNNAPPLLYEPTNHSPSEFNASHFDATLTNQIFNNLDTSSNNNLVKFQRSQSLLDLRHLHKYPSDTAGNDYTQSLDRRKYRQQRSGLKDYNSLERMNVYTDSVGRYVLETRQGSDGFRRYQDVAL